MLTKRSRPRAAFKGIFFLKRHLINERKRHLLLPIGGLLRAKSDADRFRAEAPGVPTVGNRSSQISDKLQVEQTRRVFQTWSAALEGASGVSSAVTLGASEL